MSAVYFKNLRIEQLHTWVFYLLCGFALFSNISIAVANIFLGTLTAVVLLRLLLKHDDWRNALPDGRLGTALLILMGAVLLSALFSSDISYSLRTVGDYYGYRMLGLYAVLLMVWEKRRLALIAVCIGISFAINDLAVIFQGVVQGNFRAAGFSIYMSVGGFLSMLIPVLLLLLLSRGMDVQYRIPAAAALGIGCLALLYNGSPFLSQRLCVPASWFDRRKSFSSAPCLRLWPLPASLPYRLHSHRVSPRLVI